MTFHLIDPKAGIKSANSSQNHFNTSTTTWVYFSGLNYQPYVVHVCTITHTFYYKQPLVQETCIIYKMPNGINGRGFLDFEMVQVKWLHDWSDLREIPLRVTSQNVRLY